MGHSFSDASTEIFVSALREADVEGFLQSDDVDAVMEYVYDVEEDKKAEKYFLFINALTYSISSNIFPLPIIDDWEIVAMTCSMPMLALNIDPNEHH